MTDGYTSNSAKCRLTALDFFSGSGLVTEGLRPHFSSLWANDNCPKKMRVYEANFGDEHSVLKSIEEISGKEVPKADLAWASFPCQDLSLAGKMDGIKKGARSALYWHWIRVLDEMPEESRPPILCAENVVGFLVADSGSQFKLAYDALKERGYQAGAFVLDAKYFTPQSRPRSFLVAVKKGIDISGLSWCGPQDRIHPKAAIQAYLSVYDREWIWWQLPLFPRKRISFQEICEWGAPIDPPSQTQHILAMLSETNRAKIDLIVQSGKPSAGTGYKRIRKDASGEKHQRLEVRFDGLAGCLRTPRGGSSRQIVLLIQDGEVHSRLLTIREAARLMGVRDSYRIPGTYNEAYMALGDAVAVPVTRFIARHLLAPLSLRAQVTSNSIHPEAEYAHQS